MTTSTIDVDALASEAASARWSWERLAREMSRLDPGIDPEVALEVIASVAEEHEAELGAAEALRQAIASVPLAADLRGLPSPKAPSGWQEQVFAALPDESGRCDSE